MGFSAPSWLSCFAPGTLSSLVDEISEDIFDRFLPYWGLAVSQIHSICGGLVFTCSEVCLGVVECKCNLFSRVFSVLYCIFD